MTITEPVWNSIGYNSNSIVPNDNLIGKIGIDREFGLAPISAEIEDYGTKSIASKKALYRKSDNKVLKIVSSGYGTKKQIMSSFRQIELFNNSLGNNTSDISIGRFSEFGKVWAVVKLENFNYNQIKGDNVDYYLLFSFSENNYRRIVIRLIALRLVCKNGMTSTELNIRIGEVEFNDKLIEDVKRKILRNIDYFQLAAKYLLQHEYQERDVILYLADLFGTSKSKYKILNAQGQRVFNSIEEQPGHRSGSGTWWNVFNAVTHEIDHVNSNPNIMYSAWYGKYRDLKASALTKALTFLKVDGKLFEEETDNPEDMIFM